jgi:hypothetical protein
LTISSPWGVLDVGESSIITYGLPRSQKFIRALEEQGELKRIPFPVDPVLEITGFADRAVKSGGPALLFEQPGASGVPVLINAFASMRRMEIALEVGSVDEVAARIVEFLEMRMPEGLIGKLKMLPKLAEMGAFFPRIVSKGPCQEVVRRRRFSLLDFPSCSAGPRTPGASSPCRWCFRATPTPASATAACTAFKSSTTAPPACTGRRTNRAPSTTAGG